MRDKGYLLSIRDFLDTESGEAYIQRAYHYVDVKRRQKAERAKQPGAKAAALGAGLLLQLALQEALKKEGSDEEAGMTQKDAGIVSSLRQYSASELFECLGQPLALEFRYGKQGKPYFKDHPFYFNLSHSGEYVICVLSNQEVGVDIQQHRNDDVMRLAKRFYSRGECETLAMCPDGEQQKCFFELWAKKEAYGKLTGEGVTEVLGIDLGELQSEVDFEEYTHIPDYSIAICKRRVGGKYEEIAEILK